MERTDVRSAHRASGQVADVIVLPPPGRYGYGPVHIRVDQAVAGPWRPPFDYEIERNDCRCRADPRYAYVAVENSHSAFIYVEEMINRGTVRRALSVVRLVAAKATS